MKAVGEDDDRQPANVVAVRCPRSHVHVGKLDGSFLGVRGADAERPERNEKTLDVPKLHGCLTMKRKTGVLVQDLL
jgi:hypothetical protein